MQIPFQQRPIKLQWNLVASAQSTVDHLLGPQRTFAKRVLLTLPTPSGTYVAPTLAWQYHFISCEGIQLGIYFTLKGEDVVKHFQKKFRCDGWQLEDFLWGMKTRSKPAQVKHELLLS